MPALTKASFAVRAGAQVTEIKNPIVKGYYADPTIVKYKGTFYKYATIDPWGGEELGVLETKDFKKFTVDHINWPTKKACTSPTSNGSMVWARRQYGKPPMANFACAWLLAARVGPV